MLSDEEKKAIEYIKKCLDDEYDFKNATRQKDKKAHNIILNLIKKQQKEIEELKEENKEIREWKYVIDNPIDLKKLSELDIIKIFGKSYIAKDKIKAKIEEVDYKMIAHQDVREAVKQVLQSLLGKE